MQERERAQEQGTRPVGVRQILHVDMDAFFVAVELLRRPELRGQPVIVGGNGNPHARGVVSTASYEARRFGIRSAMPLRSAWQRCPQAVFLPVDIDAYAAVSRRIKAILSSITPLVEDAGIDEAFLDVTGLHGRGEDIARTIKRRIREETGLDCSIGIAPNKLLAKLASDLEKPDGLTELREHDVATRVWPLPVRRLQGVGPRTEAKLRDVGVATIGALAGVPEGELVARFGEAQGRHLYRAARGIDDSPVVTHWEPQSFSREVTFQQDVRDAALLARALSALVREVAGRVRDHGCRGRQVGVKLRYADFDTRTHAVTLPDASDDTQVLLDAAHDVLHRFTLDRPVRLLGVRVALETHGDPAGRCR